jgi:hypothetical protein
VRVGGYNLAVAHIFLKFLRSPKLQRTSVIKSFHQLPFNSQQVACAIAWQSESTNLRTNLNKQAKQLTKLKYSFFSSNSPTSSDFAA